MKKPRGVHDEPHPDGARVHARRLTRAAARDDRRREHLAGSLWQIYSCNRGTPVAEPNLTEDGIALPPSQISFFNPGKDLSAAEKDRHERQSAVLDAGPRPDLPRGRHPAYKDGVGPGPDKNFSFRAVGGVGVFITDPDHGCSGCAGRRICGARRRGPRGRSGALRRADRHGGSARGRRAQLLLPGGRRARFSWSACSFRNTSKPPVRRAITPALAKRRPTAPAR